MNEAILTKAIELLSDVQLKFIRDEFGIAKDDLFKKTEDELDELYESFCEIEIDETMNCGDGKLSERGDTAASIVTVLGNEIAKAQGDWDESDYEKELDEE